MKIHLPLLGSSIYYKQQNIIKVKLNSTRIFYEAKLGTRFNVSRGCPQYMDLKHTKNTATIRRHNKPPGCQRNTQLTKEVCTYPFRFCQYPVLPVLRCQAHRVLASALGSHMGRFLYETLLCPEEATNGRLQVNH